MALKKERICVWITQEKREDQIVLSWLACPLAYRKETESRLQNSFNKKVKGNRLKTLQEKVSLATLPFCEEYLSTLFRISNVSGFVGSYLPKASYLETNVFERAASWLKNQFENCEFLIYYNPHTFRLSTLKSWLNKNRIHGELIIEESSLMLDTSLFLGSTFTYATNPNFPGENEASYSLQENALRHLSMALRYEVVGIQDLYLALFKKEEKKEAQALFKQAPDLIWLGIFEKWLKKGWKQESLKLVLEYLDHGLPIDILLQTSLNKLPLKMQALLEEKEKQKKQEEMLQAFPQESFEKLFSSYMDWITSLPGVTLSDVLEANFLDLWKQRLDQILEKWTQDPLAQPIKPSFYMVLEENQVSIVLTSIMPCLEQISEEKLTQLSFLKRQVVSLEELFSLLKKINALSPLPNLSVSKSLFSLIHAWSIENNLFLPLHDMTSVQRQIVCSLPIEEISPSKMAYFQFSSSAKWFPFEIFGSLSKEQKEFLATHPFGIQETRLLARAFKKGLEVERVLEYIHRTQASVLRLIRPYLYPTRVQNFLKGIGYLDELRLLSRPSLRLGQMEALLRLCSEGYPALWLQANMKGNPTLQYLNALQVRFPFGHVPTFWQACFLMEPDLFDWMLQKAKMANPKMEFTDLIEALFVLNTNLLSLLLQKPFEQEKIKFQEQ